MVGCGHDAVRSVSAEQDHDPCLSGDAHQWEAGGVGGRLFEPSPRRLMGINLKGWRADEGRTAEAIVGMHFVPRSGALGKLLLARMMPNFRLFLIVLERAGFLAAVLLSLPRGC